MVFSRERQEIRATRVLIEAQMVADTRKEDELAKTRMLKHDLRTSEKVASWPIDLRYFWVLLWGYVDDHGKGKDNPLLVKADTFPLDETVTRETVDQWLWDLAEAGVVARYTVDSVDYIEIVNWKEHQKPPHPTKDVMPSATDSRATRRGLHASRMKDAGSTPASLTNGLGWVEFEIGSGFVNESSPPVTDTAFDRAWKHWPKKVERKKAVEQYAKAAKKLTAPVLEAHVIRFGDAYAATTDRQFVPALGVWLNGERWTDELPQAPTQGNTKPTPEQRAYQTMSLAMDIDMKEIE